MAVFFIIEIIVRRTVLQVNKDFQWLIVEKDKIPLLDKQGLLKFISHGFDSELGWVRKPNTSHDEVGKFGKTNWNTNLEISSQCLSNGAKPSPPDWGSKKQGAVSPDSGAGTVGPFSNFGDDLF